MKNKVTGIDLSIPSHRVIPGLLSSTIEYHVVVVTNLPVFKSAKHKETDTVQFMVNITRRCLIEILSDVPVHWPIKRWGKELFSCSCFVGVGGWGRVRNGPKNKLTLLSEYATPLPGWSRHKENREFGSYFFQTGKTQGILL